MFLEYAPIPKIMVVLTDGVHSGVIWQFTIKVLCMMKSFFPPRRLLHAPLTTAVTYIDLFINVCACRLVSNHPSAPPGQFQKYE